MQQLIAFTGLIIAVASLALGGLVVFSNPIAAVNRVFGLLGLSLAVWGFGYYNSFSATDPTAALLWAKVFMLGAAFIPVFYLHFVVLFINRYPKFKFSVISGYILSTTFAYASLVSENFISRVAPNRWFTFWPIAGDFYIYFLVFFFAALVFSIYLLSRKSGLKAVDLLQEKYLIIGATVGLLGGATNYPQWYGIDIPPVGNILVLAFPISITYAILKTRLFNIKVLLTEVAVGVVVSIALVQTIALSGSQLVTGGLLTLSLAVGGIVLIKSVRTEVDKREEIEKLAKEKIETLKELEQRNKSLAALQRVSDIVLNEMDMKAMSQKILDEIPVQLENCVGAFLSIVRGGHLVAYTVSTNTFTRKVYSLVGEDLEKYSYPIKKEFNGLHEVLIEKKMVEGDSLDAFICPPISRPVAKTLQRLIGAKHLVALPLYASGEPLGVMMFVYKVEKSRLHGKDVEIAKAIADDMSLAIQRAQAFQKLKDANEYLSQLDKMKDEFISMASHELNTPLAAIEGYLSMVLDEGMGKVDAKSKEYLSRAYASSKRLAELILDLLNVSRIEQGRLKMKFSQVSMVELAESVVHELQIKADSKKIYLKIEAEKGLPKLWCDPDRIREVIVNLTGNALKFTDKGGVTINIGKSEGDFIRVTVVDTGRGIAKEDQKKLFQKFSQVKREIDEHQGTGLGLYISKNFVELHKGKIWVESEAGKGSKFIFEIPLLKEAPKQLEGAILEKPITEAQIEVGTKDVPTIIAESVDGKI